MTTDFVLPDIGEGIVECELLEWLVAEGDVIVEDQPVAEVMTDKATVQIPAMHDGVVKKLYYAKGDIAKVHSPLFAVQTNTDSPKVACEQNKHEKRDTNHANETSPSSRSVDGQDEDFILPDIGEGIVECEIVKWHLGPNDAVREDQVVVEVMTDKAVVEIPAKNDGVIGTLYYREGEIAKVHTPLFSLIKEQNDNQTPINSENVATNATSTVKSQSDNPTWSDGSVEPPLVINGKVLASPAVRRIARENNIDLGKVPATGKKGRILKYDVLGAISQSGRVNSEALVVESKAQSESVAYSKNTNKTVAVRGVMAAMAKQMTASVQTIPHFTVSDELQMDSLIALRTSLKPAFEENNVKLSFMPFFVKALSLALLEFPILNTQLNEDATELTYFNEHNIGFAVDSKIGLLVPNIKNVQALSLFEIATQMQDIIELARIGKLAGDYLKGGTISISNVGAIGGIVATPVINKPEAAIVALGKIQKLPRFDSKGEVTAQHIMNVSWSGDHRIVDGATVVKFNNLWMSYLQSPQTMLMHLR